MRFIRRAGALLLIALVCATGASAAFAQTGQGAQTFTLEPGGKATVTFEGFCTNFGQTFPTAIQAPNNVADDKVRGALAYIQSNNLAADQASALDAQYGIWQLEGATGSPAGGDTAKAVVNAANTVPTNPTGTSVVDAAKNGQVSVTIDSWQPIGDKVAIGSATDNFYGRGTLTIENTSQQSLTLYMPVGTLFPPATAGDQTMAAYATNVQVTQPQPTPQPTAQPTTQAAGQSNQPQNLPNTADGGASSTWLLIAGALVLLGAGYLFRTSTKGQ